MGEEVEKLESEIEQTHHQHDRKLAMVKSKLYLLLSAFSVGRELRIDRDKASMDDMFKELQHLA